MMFEPLVEVARWFLSLIPKDIRKGHFKPNFLTVHYLYMIGLSIIGSIIVYGAAFMPFNDALFFAVGAATQSGLNTININDLYTYQQVTFMLIACIANPIFINTAVVFVRLYWFEKRFKHIVKEINDKRRLGARTISRTKSEMKDDRDLETGGGGQGRHIRWLNRPSMTKDSVDPRAGENTGDAEKTGVKTTEDSTTTSPETTDDSSEEIHHAAIQDAIKTSSGGLIRHAPSDSSSDRQMEHNPASHRDIRFADEVPKPKPKPDDANVAEDQERLPEQQDASRHIAFLEKQQRFAREGTTLRIPGPREFDRGEVPEELSDSSDDEPEAAGNGDDDEPAQETDRDGINTGDEHLNADDHTLRGGITFDEAEHPGHRQNTDNTEESEETSKSRFNLDRLRNGLNRRRRGDNTQTQTTPMNGPAATFARTFSTLTTVRTRDKNMSDPMPYLSWQPTVGRNSAFSGLTEEQREELGGIEYRALKTLAKILICYFVGFHISGLVVLLPYILTKQHYKQVVLNDGQNPSWWAVFTGASLFNDLGYTLTPDSMESFQTSTVVLLWGSFLIVIGNTGFPVMLRFVIWFCSKFSSHGSPLWEELRFLLDHPRRCFTLLFPSKANWWLFWVLVGLNGLDLLFFVILDLNDKAVTHLPPGFRVLDGWFQAVSTRTAGFACVNLAKLHPAIQVSYLIMMYISVFPIAISVRRTNVYEEKSLGIFGGEEEGGDDEDNSYVGQHLRRQLSFDLWYIFLGLFFITIIEGDRISNTNEYAFTTFSVLFEIISAYGTVGLSLGYPGTDTSFAAQFKVLSKLIICAMMIRGRHRGLPYALDRAILLPSEGLQKKEAEDADRRNRPRRGSIFAEGAEAERTRTGGQGWGQYELDEYGLPKQHVRTNANGQQEAVGGNIGDEHSATDPPSPVARRRSSMASTNSGWNRRERSRSLGRIIQGGLSAGPTLSKYD